MKTNLWFLSTSILTFAAAFFAFACDDLPSEVKRAAKAPNGMVAIDRSVSQFTPAGMLVLSKESISTDILTAMDNGLGDAFRDAALSRYTARMGRSHYEVFTPAIPCVPSPRDQTPSFTVRADEYDGTEFDYHPKQGIGVIYASEMVLSVGTPGSIPPIGQMIVCPDISQVRNAVRHGAEHILIANNDAAYFWETWFHGNGRGHPLLPHKQKPAAGENLITREPDNSSLIVRPSL